MVQSKTTETDFLIGFQLNKLFYIRRIFKNQMDIHWQTIFNFKSTQNVDVHCLMLLIDLVYTLFEKSILGLAILKVSERVLKSILDSAKWYH